MRRKSLAKLGVVSLALLLALAACGSDGEPEPVADDSPTADAPTDSGDAGDGAATVPDNPDEGVTADAIEVGWMGDLTGPTASAQALNHAGTEAYFAKVNAEGGVLGRELVLNARDDQYSAETGVSNFRALVDDDRVLGLINIGGSHIMAALSPDIEQLGIPVISPPQTIDASLENPYIFHDLAHYGDMADVAVAHMTDVVGSAEDLRVAVVNLTVPSGAEWDAYIQRDVEESGGVYLGGESYAPDETDLSPIMAKLTQLRDGEGLNYVAFHGAPAHGLMFVNALGDAGLDDLPVVGIQGMAGLTIFSEGNPDILEHVAGVHSFVTYAEEGVEGADEIRAWIEGDGAEWADEARHINFSHGWVAGMTLHQALERAAADSGELSRQSLYQALQGPFDVKGLTCPKDYSETNHSPCGAPFTSEDGEHMTIIGSFEQWSSQITERYGLAEQL